MRKLFLFIAAFMFVASNIFAQDADKLSGTLSTSLNHYTYDGGYPLTNANDGSYTTKFWSNSGPNSGDYVTMTLAEEVSIGEIKFYFADGDKPTAAAVEISSDNSQWEPVASFVKADISSENIYVCDAQSALAKYVRLRFTQSQGDWFQMFEFEVYEALADLAPRTISVSVNDATMGTAYIGAEGVTEVTDQVTSVKLTAVPAEGYAFVNWTLDGEEVSTNAMFSDRTDGDKAYVANFRALEVYTVSVSVNEVGIGTATASAEGEIYEGTEVTFTATSNDGYEFVSWTVEGVVVSENSTYKTTINASANYVANFRIVPKKLPLTNVFATFSGSSYNPLSNIIDGSRYTESYVQISSGQSVTVELQEESVVGDIVLVFYDYSTYQPSQAKIQVSSDNVTYNDVEGCSFVKSDIVSGIVTLKTGGVSAKYVRLVFVETQWFDMYEFEVYESPIELPERAISVSVNDSTMGSAFIGTEGVTSVEGQTGVVRLIAVANEGYDFVNWTVDGEVVSTDAIFVDKTEGDKAYVANFIGLGTYNISVSVNNPIMGTAESTATGAVFDKTAITLTATPTDGYGFVNWTVNGEEVSTKNPYTTTVEGDAEYVANFRLLPTKLVIERMETTMAPYGSYTADKMIDGSFADGSMFDSSKRQTAHEGDITVTAVLAEESLVGEVCIYFSGNYRPSKAKIQVSTDYETWEDVEGTEFEAADAVDASDVRSGAKLITVDCGGVFAKYVRMFVTEPAAEWLTIFEFEAYEAPVNLPARAISVSVNDATMGSAYVGAEGITSLEGQTAALKLVATPSGNAYRFVNWTVEGVEVSTNESIVDRTEGDKAYVANFEAKPIYTINVVSANELLGTVSSDAAEVMYEGDVVTFTATAADGYKFSAWMNGADTVSVANPYTVTMTESISLVASFDRDPLLDRSNWEITASSEETTGEGTGNGVATCIIDGKTNTHWHSAWKNSSPAYPHWFMIDMKESKAFDAFEYVSRGAGSSTDDSNNNGNIVNYILYTSDEIIDPTNLDAATLVTSGQFTYDGVNKVHKVEFNSVKGRFVMLYATGQSANGGKHASCVEFYLYSSAFAVSVSSSNPEIGTVYIGEEGVTSVGCSVEGTDVATLTAVPADKYQFVNWTLNGEVVSTEAVYTTDLVTESRAYVANFEFAPVAPRTVTAAVNKASKGSVVFLAPESTESSVVSDNIVVLEAVPATSDDFFVNWTINGEVVSTEATYEYLEAAPATIQANFESRYVVTVDQVTGGVINLKVDGISIATGDRVLEGKSIKITVVEDSRSALKKLLVNGVDMYIPYKYNPDFTVKVTGPMTITAEYGDPICIVKWENIGNGYVEVWEYDNYDEEADEAGELEYPLQPEGEQYAWGAELPFLGTAAIFAYPMGDDELVSLTINGEEIDLEESIFLYGDHFIEEVEGPLYIVATFTGEGTGVETAEADAANVYAVAGGIKVATAEAATVSIYSIAGVLVSEQTVSETTTIAMEKGIYIVKVADKVAKVVVK